MIKIIKEGKKENYKFKKTCPICGCEFEYELKDLQKDYDYSMCLTTFPSQYRYTRYVNCPCCGERVFHDYERENQDIGNTPFVLTVNKPIFVNEHPDVCENCVYKDGPKDVFGNPTVGDSPCQWCQHYKWRVTCNCANGNSNE